MKDKWHSPSDTCERSARSLSKADRAPLNFSIIRPCSCPPAAALNSPNSFANLLPADAGNAPAPSPPQRHGLQPQNPRHAQKDTLRPARTTQSCGAEYKNSSKSFSSPTAVSRYFEIRTVVFVHYQPQPPDKINLPLILADFDMLWIPSCTAQHHHAPPLYGCR